MEGESLTRETTPGRDTGPGQDRDPLRAGLLIGTVRGIQIRVNWSVAVIFTLIAFGLAAWQFPAVSPHQATLTYVLAGILTTVVYFASLLAHEIAHSLMARRYGLTVKSITLWLFGGVSELSGEVRVWISLIGLFLTGAATAEAQQAVLASRLRGIRASQVMTPDPVTVPGSMTVSEIIDDQLFRARYNSFPVTADGGDTVTGLVTLDRIKQVPASQRDLTRLADIACPLSDIVTASPQDPVADILPRLAQCADRRALVFSGGHLAGIITLSDITQMIDRLGLGQSR